MENYKLHGLKPYKVLTVHGGPGALGELNDLSKQLSKDYGVIEHVQTQDTINLILDDINKTIIEQAEDPVTIIGYSWGAWLGILFTSKYQKLVEKLILISSGPFLEKDSKNIMDKRINRLDEKEKNEFLKLSKKFSSGDTISDRDFKSLITLFEKADSYQLIDSKNDNLYFRYDLYKKIWKEASVLRKNNELIKALERINCKINIIHGSYDPHPTYGVVKPLDELKKDYEYKILEKCGHIPWKEKYAKDKFYKTLKEMITNY
ncbi:MAG: alpha/beta fold hydrolase [Bacillota bacterium]